MGIKTAPPFHPHFDTQGRICPAKVIFFRGLCKDLAQPYQKSPTICLYISFAVSRDPVGNRNYVDSW